MVQVAIALGSNLNEPHTHLHFATSRLRRALDRLAVSAFVEAAPEDGSEQPTYLNGAVTGAWPGSARSLLDLLLTVELERGRTRSRPGDSRTLDLDLILFGDSVIDEPGLVVPHPRFRQRGFVLQPLAEIAPDMVDPVTGLRVDALYRRWKEAGNCALPSSSTR